MSADPVEPEATQLPAAAVPNDPFYSSQWHFPKVQSNAAWATSAGAGVTVAVVDSGVSLGGEGPRLPHVRCSIQRHHRDPPVLARCPMTTGTEPMSRARWPNAPTTTSVWLDWLTTRI